MLPVGSKAQKEGRLLVLPGVHSDSKVQADHEVRGPGWAVPPDRCWARLQERVATRPHTTRPYTTRLRLSCSSLEPMQQRMQPAAPLRAPVAVRRPRMCVVRRQGARFRIRHPHSHHWLLVGERATRTASGTRLGLAGKPARERWQLVWTTIERLDESPSVQQV